MDHTEDAWANPLPTLMGMATLVLLKKEDSMPVDNRAGLGAVYNPMHRGSMCINKTLMKQGK